MRRDGKPVVFPLASPQTQAIWYRRPWRGGEPYGAHDIDSHGCGPRKYRRDSSVADASPQLKRRPRRRKPPLWLPQARYLLEPGRAHRGGAESRPNGSVQKQPREDDGRCRHVGKGGHEARLTLGKAYFYRLDDAEYDG